MTSVFKHPDSSIKSALDELIPRAIQAGATRLDAFEGFLTEAYAKHGFVEVDRVPWDDKFTPEGWDKKTQGTPDVGYMELREDAQSTKTDVEPIQDPGRVRGSAGILAQQDQKSPQRGREANGDLKGLPTDIPGFKPGHNKEIENIAKKYAEDAGIAYVPPSDYVAVGVRSEERRVGEEGRSWGSAVH